MGTRGTSRKDHSLTRKLNNIKSLQRISVQRQKLHTCPFGLGGFWLIGVAVNQISSPGETSAWDLQPQAHIPTRPEETDIFITEESCLPVSVHMLFLWRSLSEPIITLSNICLSLWKTTWLLSVKVTPFYNFSSYFSFMQRVQAVPDLLSCEEIYLCLNHPYCCSAKSKALAI